VNKEDTTNNFSSQIKNKMFFTIFEIIFYFITGISQVLETK